MWNKLLVLLGIRPYIPKHLRQAREQIKRNQSSSYDATVWDRNYRR